MNITPETIRLAEEQARPEEVARAAAIRARMTTFPPPRTDGSKKDDAAPAVHRSQQNKANNFT